ncbi:MAG TPA: hypothetical protein VFB62_02565 [Polyangiaceae bacterium]|jgi:hypothetical protein|nr:hypothetical protein [Polyangiaceae bacterium]
MHIDSAHNRRSYAKIVALAWSSESFKAALLRDPATVLREHGMQLPPGTRVIVRESGPARPVDERDDGTLELTIPHPPAELEDEPIVSGLSNAYILSSPGFVPAELELTLPSPPKDLDDEPILTGMSNGFITSAPGFIGSCAPGFVHDEGELELTLPPPPKDLDDEAILTGVRHAVPGSAPGFFVAEKERAVA